MKSKKQESPVKNRRLDGYVSVLRAGLSRYVCFWELRRHLTLPMLRLLLFKVQGLKDF